MDNEAGHPVAIGGVGGSGTRVLATLLHHLGYFIGDDLNDSFDNLWFTLLFKRRSVLMESDDDFRELLTLFFSRMAGKTVWQDRDHARVFGLAEQDRLQHPRQWLVERAQSFVNDQTSKRPNQPWGWKEPNTHIVVDRILKCDPNTRYIHLVRHPLYMATSRNQNQLQNWGPIFLSLDVPIRPSTSLAYWCAAHRRIIDLMRARPGQAMIVDFDALCLEPDMQFTRIARFLDLQLRHDVLAKLRSFVRPTASVERFRDSDRAQFRALDLAYVAELGYSL